MMNSSAPARILPANGPYTKGSFGTVVTPSRWVPMVATVVATPADVTRQTFPTQSLGHDPVCSLPVTTIRSPPAAQNRSWKRLPRTSAISPGSVTHGFSTVKPSAEMRTTWPAVPLPVKDSPAVNPPWQAPVRTVATFTSFVRPARDENVTKLPFVGSASSRLFG